MAVIDDIYEHRKDIVPVLGAGISMPLGLPTWYELIGLLIDKAEEITGDTIDFPEGLPDESLSKIKTQVGEVIFSSTIKERFKIPVDLTTRTLIALVSAKLEKTITFNIDKAYENSYRLLNRDSILNVYTGESVEKIEHFVNSEGPSLLKIHGDIDDSTTWVLDTDEYNRAYSEEKSTSIFLANNKYIPLFIGFSLTDEDVMNSLRKYTSFGLRQSYAILSKNDQEKSKIEVLARHGVVPLFVDSYSDIPEFLYQMFELDQFKIGEKISEDDVVNITYGAVSYEPPGGLDSDQVCDINSIIKNAVDIAPTSVVVGSSYPRITGSKYKFVSDISTLARSQRNEEMSVVLSILLKYPDVLFDKLLPRLFADDSSKQTFNILSLLYDACDSTFHQNMLSNYLRACLDNVYSYNVTISIARVLAFRNKHPALWCSKAQAPVVRIGELEVFKYPLTRRQVTNLLGNESDNEEFYQTKSPITAYAIEKTSEIEDILKAINNEFEIDSKSEFRWRLPTVEEWQEIALVGKYKWPWGDADPELKVHAHLYYDGAGRIEKRPFDVGIFPAGKSHHGLHDLIGNVFDVALDKSGQLVLMGGAFSTYRSRLARDFAHPKLNKYDNSPNIGLRPVRAYPI